MEKLVKPSEFARRLGISRQAVYAKIKKGLLRAKSVEGKLYIVLDEEKEKGFDPNAPQARKEDEQNEKNDALLAAKDETIAVLKETIAELKHSNEQIASTLRGEIELLKEAFNEMRRLYAHRLVEANPMTTDVLTHEASQEQEERWISLKDYMKRHGIEKKQKSSLKKRLKRAFKAGDVRVVKEGKKFRIDSQSDLSDILA